MNKRLYYQYYSLQFISFNNFKLRFLLELQLNYYFKNCLYQYYKCNCHHYRLSQKTTSTRTKWVSERERRQNRETEVEDKRERWEKKKQKNSKELYK